MPMLDRVKDWIWGPPFGWRSVTRVDLLLALVLSALAEVIVSGNADKTDPQGGLFACVCVLLMTVPVAWRRAHPLGAMMTLAGGAVFNAIAVGSYVRCGAALPSLALVVYSVGARCEQWPALAGAALAVVSTAAQGLSDPQLKHGFWPVGSVLILALWGVGRLVRSRDGMVAALRVRTQELRVQRDRTARLAVAADRARVVEDLDAMLGARIGKLAADAAVARDAISTEPEAARLAMTDIEQEGRRALTDMREIVGALRDDGPVTPQPSLADLEALLQRTLSPSARLTIEGTRHRLPAGVELSAFRIVERLLESLEDVPGARVRVTVRYEPDLLAVGVHGRVRAGADHQTTLATAREWVTLHAGTLESRSLSSGVAQTDVRLPLVTVNA
jgi:signal transduction histidine kinase